MKNPPTVSKYFDISRLWS